MRAVGVEEAAAVGAELLDDLLRRDRTLRDRLLADDRRCALPSASVVVTVCGSTTLTLSYGRRFWTTPCDTSTSAPTTQIGSSTQSEAAHQVDPEVAERVLLLLRDAADERDRERDADRRRDEVVVREPRHLREVAHRRLAAVRLPVRVGRERRGGVERERRRDTPAKPCGFQGSHCCSRCIAYSTSIETTLKSSIADGVLGPAHLACLVDAGESIDQPLERAQDRIEPRALAGEDPRHEAAERRRHREDRQQEEARFAASR